MDQESIMKGLLEQGVLSDSLKTTLNYSINKLLDSLNELDYEQCVEFFENNEPQIEIRFVQITKDDDGSNLSIDSK